MSQESVYELLKKKNDWMLSKELLIMLKISDGGLYRCLRKLEKGNEIIKRKASEVINDKNRLSKTSTIAWAYKINN